MRKFQLKICHFGGKKANSLHSFILNVKVTKTKINMERFLYCLEIMVWAIRSLKATSTIFTVLSKPSYFYDSHFICIHILGVRDFFRFRKGE